jgi:hypothetical protein
MFQILPFFGYPQKTAEGKHEDQRMNGGFVS